jgi:NADH dehydrogenase
MAPPLVIVVGGSGFVGTHVVKALVRLGCMVKVLVRDKESGAHLKPLGDVGQICVFSADLNDMTTITPHLQGATAVINLVGILKQSAHQQFFTLHSQMAGILADEAAKAGVGRFIHMSALGVDKAKADSRYAASKSEGEDHVKHFFPSATIIRPSVIFGAGDGFFTLFAKITSLVPLLPLAGGGKTMFQPVFVGDVAEVMARAVFDKQMQGQLYELGGPERITLKQVIAYISELTGASTCVVPIPFWVMRVVAWLTGWLPGAPVTADQVQLLLHPNIVNNNAKTFDDLRMETTSFRAVVPAYLEHFTAAKKRHVAARGCGG